MKTTMTKRWILAAALMVAAGVTGAAEIGVVDMERLMKLHPRAATDRQALETYVEDFEAEREERVRALQAMSEEFDSLRKASEDVSLSEAAAQEKRRLAQLKIEEIRQAERDLRETAALRQRELTSQELRMRSRVVADIRKQVAVVAAEKKLTLVLDATGPGAAGYAPVLFSTEGMDITEAVLALMLKAGKPETE